MSGTLTWHNSVGTKTGTAVADWITDVKNMIDANSGDADFKWEVADFEDSVSPLYVSLKRKDASAGRILILSWTSSPAGNNPHILDITPTSNIAWIAYFPNGTGDTPANLTASSGNIFTDDTDCSKVSSAYFLSSGYGANYKPFYFDCEDGIFLATQDPGSAQAYWMGAGDLLVDDADNVYPCSFGAASNSITSFAASSPAMQWSSTVLTAGSFSISAINGTYPLGSSARFFFQAFGLSGSWGTQVGTIDMMNDSSNSKVNFQNVPLLGQVKGEGIKLKLRQIACGPGSTSPLNQYDGTGPVVKAVQASIATGGALGAPYMTNFKV